VTPWPAGARTPRLLELDEPPTPEFLNARPAGSDLA
jgi:hypothetical protein